MITLFVLTIIFHVLAIVFGIISTWVDDHDTKAAAGFVTFFFLVLTSIFSYIIIGNLISVMLK